MYFFLKELASVPILGPLLEAQRLLSNVTWLPYFLHIDRPSRPKYMPCHKHVIKHIHSTQGRESAGSGPVPVSAKPQHHPDLVVSGQH